MYNLDHDLGDPIRTVRLLPTPALTRYSFSAMEDEMEAVSFDFGNPNGEGWEPFRIWMVTKAGEVWSLDGLILDQL